MDRHIEVVGVDHGWSGMKTVSQVFTTGVKEITTEPAFYNNVVEFNGSYYKVGGKRLEVRDLKVENDNFYILTLAAVAKELNRRGMRNANILLSVGLPLAFLENKQVLRMLSKDDLNLAELGIGVNGDGETKTALFCVIPDSDKSYNFIIGMLYTQIFQELYYQADFNCGGRLPIHVTFMLDEFANVALPDDYCSLLSTMRSREISSIIIIQNFAQLKALFKDTWETIPGNCVRPEVASAI